MVHVLCYRQNPRPALIVMFVESHSDSWGHCYQVQWRLQLSLYKNICLFGWWSSPVQLLPSPIEVVAEPLQKYLLVWLVESHSDSWGHCYQVQWRLQLSLYKNICLFGWWSSPVQLLPSPMEVAAEPLQKYLLVWSVEFSCATVTKSSGGCSWASTKISACLVGGVLLCNCYQVQWRLQLSLYKNICLFGRWSSPVQLLPSPVEVAAEPLQKYLLVWSVEFSCATVTKSNRGCSWASTKISACLVGGVLLCNCYQVQWRLQLSLYKNICLFGRWSSPVQLLPSPIEVVAEPLQKYLLVWLVEFSCATVTKSNGGCSWASTKISACLVGGVLLCNCYQVQ